VGGGRVTLCRESPVLTLQKSSDDRRRGGEPWVYVNDLPFGVHIVRLNLRMTVYMMTKSMRGDVRVKEVGERGGG
jgi:hypothetical protein